MQDVWHRDHLRYAFSRDLLERKCAQLLDFEAVAVSRHAAFYRRFPLRAASSTRRERSDPLERWRKEHFITPKQIASTFASVWHYFFSDQLFAHKSNLT